MRAESVAVLKRFRREKPSPQHLSHIFLYDRLDGLFTLALEDVVQFALKLTAERITLGRVAGQE